MNKSAGNMSGVFVYICGIMAIFLGSVDQYAQMYEEFMTDSFGTPKDQAIANLGYRIKTTTASWRRYGPRDYINRPEFRAAYINNKTGNPIDIIADLASETGLNVTPNDVVNFMLKYPGGKGNRDSRSLKTFYGRYNPANVLPDFRKEFLKAQKSKKPEKADFDFDTPKKPEKQGARLVKYLPQRGTSNKAKDEARPFSMSPGKRISKSGKVYWETRKNRSDDFLTGFVKL
jgi:hypothetical protein